MRKASGVLVALAVACGDSGSTTAGGSGTPGSTTAGETAGASTGPGTTTAATTTATSTSGAGSSSSTGGPLEGYDDPALWLCHPNKAPGDDQCLSADLTATAFLPDGTTEIVEHVPATDPAFDCFYVYPTVDISLTPGQTQNFDDISQELDPLVNQAARFTSMCRMFAPLYHQVTIGTYSSSQRDELLDAAYQDVLAAFQNYLDNDANGRPLVLMGHSQGTYMTTRLLQEVIEPDDALHGRLIAALLLGGTVSVPFGDVVGGTFADTPLCQSQDDFGCVITYRTYAADLPPTSGAQAPDIPGNDLACTSPPTLAGKPLESGAFFATSSNQPAVFPVFEFGMPVDTPFVLFRDFYGASCMTDSDGLSFLGITVDPAMGDTRQNPIPFDYGLFDPSFLGLHVLDYNFGMQDLLDLVAAKATAYGV